MALFQRTKNKKNDKASQQSMLTAAIGDEEINPFPALISEALQLVADPDFDVAKTADLLMNDPGVTVRLLGLVNSAALSRGRKVTSVHQAVVIVGRNQLESLLISLAVKSSLPSPKAPGFDAGRFWFTAARRATIAGELAMLVDPSRRSENFTAALLQDMALPVLAARSDGYTDTLQDWHESTTDLTSLEQQNHGWDHGQIGSLMAASWDLPEDLVDFLDAHHSTVQPADHLLPAKIVAPIRESDETGDEQLVQAASELYSLPPERIVDLVDDAAAETHRLAALFS